MTVNWQNLDKHDTRVDPYLAWAQATGFRYLHTRVPGYPSPSTNFVTFFVRAKDPDAGIEFIQDAWKLGLQVLGATPQELGICPYATLLVPLNRLAMGLQFMDGHCDRYELTSPASSKLQNIILLDPAKPERSSTPVVLGLIDDACPFAHRSWRGRVLRWWKQELASAQPLYGGTERFGRASDMGYGVEFHRRYLVPQPALLAMSDAMARYRVGSSGVDEARLYADADLRILGHRESHGAHMLDLMAGPVRPSGRLPRDRTPRSGMKPAVDLNPSWVKSLAAESTEADIVAVEWPRQALEDRSGRWLSGSIIDGLRFILRSVNENLTEKVVVNISYGHTGGPHDGSSMLEGAMDTLCLHYDGARAGIGVPANRPKLTIVLPAGNSFLSRAHAKVSLAAQGQATLRWRVLPDGRRPTFLELWVDDATKLQDLVVNIRPPGCPASGALAPGAHALNDADGRALAVAVWSNVDTAEFGQKPHLLVAVQPTYDGVLAGGQGGGTAPHGEWRIELTSTRLAGDPITVDAYAAQTSPHLHSRRTGTISWFVDSQYDPEAYLRSAEGDDPLSSAQVKRLGTLNGIATGTNTLVATGVRYIDKEHSVYASAGPARNGRTPDVAIPIDESRGLTGLRAAGNFGATTLRLTGTSCAAPLLAREVAEGKEPSISVFSSDPLHGREVLDVP